MIDTDIISDQQVQLITGSINNDVNPLPLRHEPISLASTPTLKRGRDFEARKGTGKEIINDAAAVIPSPIAQMRSDASSSSSSSVLQQDELIENDNASDDEAEGEVRPSKTVKTAAITSKEDKVRIVRLRSLLLL